MFECLIRNNETLQTAYERSAAQLEEHGYPAQAEIAPDGANLFLFGQGRGGDDDLAETGCCLCAAVISSETAKDLSN